MWRNLAFHGRYPATSPGKQSQHPTSLLFARTSGFFSTSYNRKNGKEEKEDK
jgi:hypothetical protein